MNENKHHRLNLMNWLKGSGSAFTMAEIMIALTIIGVVAAITLPQLIGNTGGRSHKLMMQKNYALLSQALKIGSAKLEYNTSEVDRIVNKTGSGAEDLNLQISIENLLTKTMDVKKLDTTTHAFSGKYVVLGATDTTDETAELEWEENEDAEGITVNDSGAGDERGAIFETRDGSYIIFPDKKDIDSYACTKASPCLAYIDVNGPESPNSMITCSNIDSTGYWYWDYEENSTGEVTKDETKYMKNSTTEAGTCTVDPMRINDVFPVLIYGGTVVPALNAVEAVITDHS